MNLRWPPFPTRAGYAPGRDADRHTEGFEAKGPNEVGWDPPLEDDASSANRVDAKTGQVNNRLRRPSDIGAAC